MATINSFQELRNYMNTILKSRNQYDKTKNQSPHGLFWDIMSYTDFTTGNIPGIGIAVLVIGDSKNSNFIKVLRGEDDLTQMPLGNNPYFSETDIAPIAKWIDDKCPE